VNADNQRAEKKLEELRDDLKHSRASIEKTNKTIEDLERQLASERETLDTLLSAEAEVAESVRQQKEKVDSLTDEDVLEVREEIANSEEINRHVRANAEREEAGKRLEIERTRSKAMTDEMKAIDDQKDTLRAKAKWPVEGLGYDETGVTFNALPFDQVSASEQRRVAVSIACSLQPTLKFFFIKDGSLLDDQAKAEFAAIAAENGCQVFMEVVGDGNEAHIVIENGEISRADDGMVPAESAEEELPEEPDGA
jgi:hypothetical protein